MAKLTCCVELKIGGRSLSDLELQTEKFLRCLGCQEESAYDPESKGLCRACSGQLFIVNERVLDNDHNAVLRRFLAAWLEVEELYTERHGEAVDAMMVRLETPSACRTVESTG